MRMIYMCLLYCVQFLNQSQTLLISKKLSFRIPTYPKYSMQMFRKQSTQDRQNLKRVIDLQTNALVTDIKYNHNGTKVAVSDSQGNVFIYAKNQDTFVKSSSFKGDQAAIWKISWADPQFGQLIAVGSFKKKVGVFQIRNFKWVEIAKHEHHEGSVNHVQWAPAAYGIKLYSAGSQGKICIFEVKKNTWDLMVFPTHESSINSLSIKPIQLNEQNFGLEHVYPTIATISKDLNLRVWRHITQAKHYNLQNLGNYQEGIYKQVLSVKPHNQLTRTILFQPIWSSTDNAPVYNIISGSQDGSVKMCEFKNDELVNEYLIHQGQSPVVNLSQSLTGKYLLVGVASHNQEKTFFYQQKQKGEWEVVQEEC